MSHRAYPKKGFQGAMCQEQIHRLQAGMVSELQHLFAWLHRGASGGVEGLGSALPS